MVTRKPVSIALVIALAGVFAVNSADADTPEARRVEVLELKVQNDQYAYTDLDPKGPSLGDAYVYSGTATKDGRGVGRERSVREAEVPPRKGR